MNENVIEKLCEILDKLGYCSSSKEILENDIDLRDFILDSVEFVTLIVEIETAFSIELPNEFLDFDILASLHGIIYAIESLLK